jgi:hypothetical protein
MRIEPRLIQIGDIFYTYIPSKKNKHPFQLFPPDEFDNYVFDIVRTMPKNLLQLNDPFVFYGLVKATQVHTPHRFNVVYSNNISLFIKNLGSKLSVNVFLIHSETAALMELLELLRKSYSLCYFIFVDEDKKPLPGFEGSFIIDNLDFIAKLRLRKLEIEEMLFKVFQKQKIEFKIDLPATEYHSRFNPASYFKASHTNYWMLNQMIGNDWALMREKDDDEKIKLESTEALKKSEDNLDRYDILIEQISNIQQLELIVLKDRNIKLPNAQYDYLSPIIIVIPFNYPSLKQFLGLKLDSIDKETKKFLGALSQEQAQNYVVYTEATGVDPKDMNTYAYSLSRKTKFLDGVAYLHGSFTHSPVFRFPAIGDSVKRELSFFKPETITATKFKNSKNLINLFGAKLAGRILPKSRETKIFGVPNQIVAITDLPVEWMIFKGINLCSLYDITRIPELPFGGILSSYNLHSNLRFGIKEDVLEHVLVILGVSPQPGVDESFKAYFNLIEAASEELKFKTARCGTVASVIEQVQKHKPDILIFDCHGSYDENTLSSYLHIGKEKITGKDIVENGITAPIIFLSACHTNPNYGYVNKIADAFFEAGCLAVTATYFPISVRGGTNIYFRLLHQLKIASTTPIHKNWLEFICHIVRTSYLKEVIYQCELALLKSKIENQKKTQISEQLKELDLDSSLQMLRQTNREHVFKNFQSKLKAIIPAKLLNVDKIVAEHCFYTNIGRGDLITFDSWQAKFNALNSSNGGK